MSDPAPILICRLPEISLNTTALPKQHQHPTQHDEPRSRKGPLAWLVATQLFVVLSIYPWIIVAMLALITLDVKTAPALWAVLIVVCGYPAYSLYLAFGAWQAYRRGETRRAMVLTTLPLIPALAMLGYLAWAASPPS
jgi:hypothetical protein